MTTVSKVAAEKFNSVLQEHLSPEHYNDPTIAEFISYYILHKNIKEAAKLSKISTADGKYLYNCADIYKTIEKLNESEVVKYGYNASEVVERTKEIAFCDPADAMNPDGTYKESLTDMPVELRRAIKRMVVKNIFEDDFNGVPQYKGKVISIEFWDKPKTLELLGREKDTFKKTTIVEHDVSKNARNFLLESVNRGENAVKQIDAPKAAVQIPVIDIDTVETVTIPLPPGM